MTQEYSDPVKLPAFETDALGDAAEADPVEAIVVANLKRLRGGVDAWVKTEMQYRNGELSKGVRDTGISTAADQISEARSELAGCGVSLPMMTVNTERTTAFERLHELGRWVYQFFRDEVPWTQRDLQQ